MLSKHSHFINYEKTEKLLNHFGVQWENRTSKSQKFHKRLIPEGKYEKPSFNVINFGSNLQGLRHIPRNPEKRKVQNWIEKERGLVPEYYSSEHHRKYNQTNTRRLPPKIETEHKEIYIDNFVKSGVIKPFKFKYRPKNKDLLKIQIVGNNDGTTRFICYNHELNKRMKIGSPIKDVKSVINMILQSKARFIGKIDFVKGFFNYEIHRKNRKYYRFENEGKYYEFQRLIQGSSDSPGIFQLLTYENIVLPSLEGTQGVNVINYVDDIIVFGDDQEEVRKVIRRIEILMTFYNNKINYKKSIMTPSTEIEILGHTINTKKESIKRKSLKLLYLLKFKNFNIEKLKGKIDDLIEFIPIGSDDFELGLIPLTTTIFSNWSRLFESEKRDFLKTMSERVKDNIKYGINRDLWLQNNNLVEHSRYQLKNKIKSNWTGQKLLDSLRYFIPDISKVNTKDQIQEYYNHYVFTTNNKLKSNLKLFRRDDLSDHLLLR